MDKRKEKEQVLKEYLSGGTTTRKLGQKYGCSHITISRLVMADKQEKEKNRLELLQSAKFALKEQQAKPVELKALQEKLRMAELQICLLEAMIEIADDQFGTDIKKKAGTRQS